MRFLLVGAPVETFSPGANLHRTVSWQLYAAAAIFLATYVLISIRRFRLIAIERPAVAMLGAALMVLVGVVSPVEALAAIDVGVLVLLLGMMLLVGGLEVCGFFDWVSLFVAARARTQLRFLASLMAATALLSALVLNDAVVFLMTPIVVRSCRSMRVDPVPYLVAEAVAANVGSVATEVGNPQNAYIGIASGIPFLDYTVVMAPIAAACLAVAIALLWVAFRRRLAAPITRPAPEDVTPLIVRRRGVAFTLVAISATVAGFFVTPTTYLPALALAGGSFVLFFLPAVEPGWVSSRGLMAKVDWSILLFFIGLFVVIAGVERSGLSAAIENGVPGVSGGALRTVPGLSVLSALLSNMVSNVPAVLLLAPLVRTSPAAAQKPLWLALAASSTLAGNATILGAAANVIVVQAASKEGVEVSMADFVRGGLPTTLATLALSIAVLTLFL